MGGMARPSVLVGRTRILHASVGSDSVLCDASVTLATADLSALAGLQAALLVLQAMPMARPIWLVSAPGDSIGAEGLARSARQEELSIPLHCVEAELSNGLCLIVATSGLQEFEVTVRSSCVKRGLKLN